ncbi:hypothetical protein JOC54_001612 [Alkalihalobacillus xiaoxiensis]|uniref:Uncharacterized protein n=1 Tax=Shouchella xiaoxiensis TaxID=766895 RepID=A0ABS2SS80_9BACI|nr:hypothetical protein [Shouchella xiaoxiensis]MBM7838356.1 hypothetical protein [Shouchella xiaoxiensis]
MEIKLTFKENEGPNATYHHNISTEIKIGENVTTTAYTNKSYIDLAEISLQSGFYRLAAGRLKDVSVVIIEAEGFETPESIQQYLNDKYSVHKEIKEVTFKAR